MSKDPSTLRGIRTYRRLRRGPPIIPIRELWESVGESRAALLYDRRDNVSSAFDTSHNDDRVSAISDAIDRSGKLDLTQSTVSNQPYDDPDGIFWGEGHTMSTPIDATWFSNNFEQKRDKGFALVAVMHADTPVQGDSNIGTSDHPFIGLFSGDTTDMDIGWKLQYETLTNAEDRHAFTAQVNTSTDYGVRALGGSSIGHITDWENAADNKILAPASVEEWGMRLHIINVSAPDGNGNRTVRSYCPGVYDVETTISDPLFTGIDRLIVGGGGAVSLAQLGLITGQLSPEEINEIEAGAQKFHDARLVPNSQLVDSTIDPYQSEAVEVLFTASEHSDLSDGTLVGSLTNQSIAANPGPNAEQTTSSDQPTKQTDASGREYLQFNAAQWLNSVSEYNFGQRFTFFAIVGIDAPTGDNEGFAAAINSTFDNDGQRMGVFSRDGGTGDNYADNWSSLESWQADAALNPAEGDVLLIAWTCTPEVRHMICSSGDLQFDKDWSVHDSLKTFMVGSGGPNSDDPYQGRIYEWGIMNGKMTNRKFAEMRKYYRENGYSELNAGPLRFQFVDAKDGLADDIQGITWDPDNRQYIVFDAADKIRVYDDSFNLVQENLSVFSGTSVVNGDLGGGEYYNGKIYTTATGDNSHWILVYDPADLSLISEHSTTHKTSGLTVDPDRDRVYTSAWSSGFDFIYWYDIADLDTANQVTLPIDLDRWQGLTYYKGMIITAVEGTGTIGFIDPDTWTLIRSCGVFSGDSHQGLGMKGDQLLWGDAGNDQDVRIYNVMEIG